MYSLPKVNKTSLEAAKEALLLKIDTLEMAIRKCSRLHVIQTVIKHVCRQLSQCLKLLEDNKVLPVKRKLLPNQTVKGNENSFNKKKRQPQTLSKTSSVWNKNCKRSASIL